MWRKWIIEGLPLRKQSGITEKTYIVYIGVNTDVNGINIIYAVENPTYRYVTFIFAHQSINFGI